MRPLDHLLTLAAARIVTAAKGDARRPAERLAGLLAVPPGPAETAAPRRLPVCRHLDAACHATSPDLAAAFRSVEPQLYWRTREIAGASRDFADGHAGARVLDVNGLEQRGGLIAGISLVAPGVTYPEHDHPPEELYLALSGGEWWKTGSDWHAPGAGGIVHNPPGIRHAMRAGAVPLLAIWFLLPDA